MAANYLDKSWRGDNLHIQNSLRDVIQGGDGWGTHYFRSVSQETTGKYYFELEVLVYNTTGRIGVIAPSHLTDTTDNNLEWTLSINTGLIFWQGASGQSGSVGGGIGLGDIVNIAVDFDAGKIWFGKNGVYVASGDPAAGTGEQMTGVAGYFGGYVAGIGNNPLTGDKYGIHFATADQTYSAPAGFGESQAVEPVRGDTWAPEDFARLYLFYPSADRIQKASGIASYNGVRSDHGRQTGKYYFEQVLTTLPSPGLNFIGVMSSEIATRVVPVGAPYRGLWGVLISTTTTDYIGDGSQLVSSGTLFALSDVINVAVDLDAGKIWIGKNGTWIDGDPSLGTGNQITLPAFTADYAHIGAALRMNTQQITLDLLSAEWAYTAPAGFGDFAATVELVAWSDTLKAASCTLSNSDLTATFAAGGSLDGVLADVGRQSGRIAYRATFDASAANFMVGIARDTVNLTGNTIAAPYTDLWVADCTASTTIVYGESGQTSDLITGGWVDTDVINVYIDYDAGKIWFGRNGVPFSGDPVLGSGQHLSFNAGAVDAYPVAFAAVSGVITIDLDNWTMPFGYQSFLGVTQIYNPPVWDPTPANDPIVYPNPDVSPPAITAPAVHAYTDGDSWSLLVNIDSVDVTSQISGEIKRTREKNAATTLSFTITPDAGVIDASDWIGKPVTVDYIHGTTRRLFTGRIETTEVDIDNAEVFFFCVDNYEDIINAMSKATIAANVGGYWSERVFNEGDNFSYMQNLISTRVVTYDLDVNGTPFLAWMAPEVTAHYSFINANIDIGSFGFKLADRSRLVNKSVIKFDFNFERLRHRQRYYFFRMQNSFENYITVLSFELPTKEMIEIAADRAGWAFKVDQWDELPQTGSYFGQTLINLSREFLFGATFWLAKRFAQPIREDYEITINAPQSQLDIGVAETQVSYSLNAEHDFKEWEDLPDFEDPVGTLAPSGDWITDATDRELDGRPAFNNDINTAQANEITRIIKSHYDNFVFFSAPCQPELERWHTIECSINNQNISVDAKGTLHSDELTLDPVTGFNRHKMTVVMSKTDPASPPAFPTIAPPAIPDSSDAPVTSYTLQLGSHLGGEQTSPPYDETWEGFTGNYSQIFPASETYERRFDIASEDVDADHRDLREVAAPSTVDIPIPDDLLTITRL